MANFDFPNRAKLTKTDEFSSVFNFRKRLCGRYLVIHYQYNQCAAPRLGMVVSKKIARLAVQRNYMKRVLRELFRTQCQHFQPVDLVIRPQKAFGHAEYPAVASEFRALMARIPPTLRTHILDNSD